MTCIKQVYTSKSSAGLNEQQKWALGELKHLGLWGKKYNIQLHDEHGAVIPVKQVGLGFKGWGLRFGVWVVGLRNTISKSAMRKALIMLSSRWV